jgi:hypothetical protein
VGGTPQEYLHLFLSLYLSKCYLFFGGIGWMSIFDAFPRTPIKITRDFSPRKFQKFSKMKFVLFVSLEIQYNYFLALQGLKTWLQLHRQIPTGRGGELVLFFFRLKSSWID